MSLYISTLRYLTWSQMWHRAYRTARRQWWRISDKSWPRPENARLREHAPLYLGLPEVVNSDAWREEIANSVARAESISRWRFYFLRKSFSFVGDIRWNEPEVSQLWRYNLHCFNYVSDLLVWGASANMADAYNTFRRLVLSWIENNRVLVGDGWHPYTVSLRLVNWLHAFSFFTKEMAADEEFAQPALQGAYGQAQFLLSNLELDVRGNHLLENLRALIWAGLAFEGAEARKWFKRGIKLLATEVDEQILSDGGHFERSPGYHLIVFRDLIEISVWLKRNGGGSPAWLENALSRMSQYLLNILPLDGRVPLLKDSTWDTPFSARQLLAACAIHLNNPSLKRNGQHGFFAALIFGCDGHEQPNSDPIEPALSSIDLPASGHFVIRDDANGDYLILDAGKTCPDYLPAHAQADLLSYELSVANQRIVVDSGVYEYAAGPWRDYFRSTRAHNTVEVGAENQSEVWSSFRVGRRARPGPIVWQISDAGVLVQAEHDGYKRLSVPVIHQRTLVAMYDKFWLVVDQLWGDGRTTLANHLHLHPDLTFEQSAESTWRVQNSRVPLWITSFGTSQHSIVKGQMQPVRQGWASEYFGELRANEVLTLHQHGALPICFGYAIGREAPASISAETISKGTDLAIRFEGGAHTLHLARHERPRLK